MLWLLVPVSYIFWVYKFAYSVFHILLRKHNRIIHYLLPLPRAFFPVRAAVFARVGCVVVGAPYIVAGAEH
jgi:hypothetical protein